MITAIDYVAGSADSNYVVSERAGTYYVDPDYTPDSISIVNDDSTTALTVQAVDAEQTTAGADRYITPAITVNAGETLDVIFGSFKKLQVRASVAWRMIIKKEL